MAAAPAVSTSSVATTAPPFVPFATSVPLAQGTVHPRLAVLLEVNDLEPCETPLRNSSTLSQLL